MKYYVCEILCDLIVHMIPSHVPLQNSTHTRDQAKRSRKTAWWKTWSPAKHGDRNWPARSCELTLCDYFLWGYLKSLVFANNPQTIQDLKEEIIRAIDRIQQEVCEKVIENFFKRCRACQQAAGGHLQDIIFHY